MGTYKKNFILTLTFALFFTSYDLTAQSELPKTIPFVSSSWWQIANEDYDAGIYSNKPKPGEPTLKDHQQVSDFTIYKSANGKWQMVSAVRNTKFPSGRHFLMRWEANDLTDQNWKEKGIFYTTKDFPAKAGYSEGIFYAPHCVYDNGKFYMFHNSNGGAYLLISDDGIKFNPYINPDGSYVIFDAGDGGRDLMVMDNRKRDGLWYVYYTCADRKNLKLENRQFTDAYVRTSKNLLGTWSAPDEVGLGTPNRPRTINHSPYDFVNAESSFVIYHDGFYFKFEQANVVASRDPKNFEGKPIVAKMFPDFKYPEEWWPALAPEVIIDGDKMYIAYFMNHYSHPFHTLKQGGVFIAELSWKTISE